MTRLRNMLRLSPSAQEIFGIKAHDEVTFVPMDAIQDGSGGLDASETKPLSELSAGSYSYFREGDLLLAKVTPCFENGKKALASELSNGIGFATSEVHVLRPDPLKLDPRFLLHLLSSEDFRADCMKSMTGAGGLKRISEAAIMNYRPKVTDLPTQKRIAAFLDRETARIDELIAKKQRLSGVLKESLLSELERHVTPETQVHAELIPFRWVCRITEGQVDPASPEWADQPLIAPNHIESRTGRLVGIETAAEQGAISGKYAFPSGTVLYSKIRPNLAKACISPVKGMCSADMYPVLPDHRLTPQFLLMQLISAKFTDWATLESMRVAMPKINRETLGSYRLWVPSIDIQDASTARFFAAQAQNEALLKMVHASIDRLHEYRAALITVAVTGQIDVNMHGNAGVTSAALDQIEEVLS